MIQGSCRIILRATFLLALTACESGLTVAGGSQSQIPSVEELDRLSAKPGETVTVTGANLTDDVEVMVNDKPVTFNRIDNKTGTIEIPAYLDPGLLNVSFKMKGKAIASLPIMNGDSLDKMVPVSVPLKSICDSYIVKNESGELSRGYANCKGEQILCATDGQSRCTTTEGFPAVVKAGLADKVHVGKSLIGVDGNVMTVCGDSN